MTPEQLETLVLQTLEDAKAQHPININIGERSSLADRMIVATGTSNRHCKAIADQLVEASKKQGHRPLGVEGEEESEWVLVDLGDIIVHIMQQHIREFYQLEKLWQGRTEHASVS